MLVRDTTLDTQRSLLTHNRDAGLSELSVLLHEVLASQSHHLQLGAQHGVLLKNCGQATAFSLCRVIAKNHKKKNIMSYEPVWLELL